MTPSEYQHLIGFLSKKFDGIDTRLDGIDTRLDGHGDRLGRLEIGQEWLTHDLKAVVEGVTMNGQRLDRVDTRLDGIDDTLRDQTERAVRDD